jgi:hypothetical protein
LRRFLAAFVTIVVSVSLVVGLFAQSLPIKNEKGKPVYVDVAFQGETVAEAKLLIDRVKEYTNLFVLVATSVSRDEAAANEVCEYAIAYGLNLVVNLLQ